MPSNYYNRRTALAADTWTEVAAATEDAGLQCDLRVVNKSTEGPARVGVFIDESNSVSAADYIEEHALVERGFPLIDARLVLKAGQKLYVRSDNASTNVVVMGELELID